jgi:hypothetical protein
MGWPDECISQHHFRFLLAPVRNFFVPFSGTSRFNWKVFSAVREERHQDDSNARARET